MSGFKPFLRNLSALWGSHSARLLVAFFLSPFVIHTLGDVRYGIWSLVLSVVGYMGLADVGLRRSISKHVNEYLARKEERKALEIISTSLALLSLAGVFILLVAWLLGRWFHVVFPGVDSVWHNEVRVVLLLAALELSVGLLASVFRRAAEAFDRFDKISFVEVTVLALRTAGVVAVLFVVPSLTGLAVVSVAASLIKLLGFALLAFRVWPGLRVSPAHCSKRAARALGSFGVPAFLDSIAWRIIRFTDLILVGALLGLEVVTYYAIGSMVASHARNFLVKIVTVLTPEIFKKAGVGDHAASRRLFLRSSNAMAFVGIPVLLGCIFFAHDFIRLWMGPQYGQAAGILQILAAATLVFVFARPAGVIILGYGRASLAAALSGVEAVANLALSVILVKVFGLGAIGVALGTLIPALIVEGVCRPLVAMRLIGMKPQEFLTRAVARWALAGGLFAAVCLAGTMVPGGTWMIFLFTAAAMALAYAPIGWYGLLDKETRAAVRPG